jgi:hypothetical protein
MRMRWAGREMCVRAGGAGGGDEGERPQVRLMGWRRCLGQGGTRDSDGGHDGDDIKENKTSVVTLIHGGFTSFERCEGGRYGVRGERGHFVAGPGLRI